jgi:hypothetical protein
MQPTTNNRKFYTFTGLFLATGWLWILYNYYLSGRAELQTCIVKRLTDIPCPGCGTTRSVLSLMQGHWFDAVWFNPLGILSVLGLVVGSAMWIYDTLIRRTSLLQSILLFERFLNKPPIAVVALILILINWYWNITKGL